MRLKLLSSALALILLLPLTSTAQHSDDSATSSDEAVAIAKALAELEGRRAQVAALKEALAAKDRHVATLEALIAGQAQLIELWKTAATERRDANAIDSRLQQSYEESVTRYKEEIERVRGERDSARRQRWLYGFGGAVLGAVVAILAAKD